MHFHEYESVLLDWTKMTVFRQNFHGTVMFFGSSILVELNFTNIEEASTIEIGT
jgi:hypothetical protein